MSRNVDRLPIACFSLLFDF
jgi:hypothetical protein